MDEVLYEERQHVEPWIFALLVTFIAGSIGLAFYMDRDAPDALAAPLIVGHVAFFANLLTQRTRVRRGEVYVQLGWIVPLYWKRLPLDQIRSGRAVDYRPLRDAGGWGIRFGKFEGAKTSFLNIRGSRGVWLDTGKRPLIVGSQHPEALWRAIEKARHRVNT